MPFATRAPAQGQPGWTSATPILRPSGRRQLQVPRAFTSAIGRGLGHEVSDVRFFESSGPERLGARAFARRREVHFARGAFDLRSHQGRHVLAHELAHVAQQARGRVRPTLRAGAVDLNEDPGLEREADQLGARALAGMRHAFGGGADSRSWGGDGSAGTEAATAHASGAAGAGGVAQMNGDGEGLLSGFVKRHLWGPHSYKVSHPVMPSSPSNLQNVEKDLVQHPAPMAGPSSESGAKRFVFPFGFINTMHNPQQHYITNTTVPGQHLLHPGDVKRTVRDDGQHVMIDTEGHGHGMLPSLNNAFANALWGGQAKASRYRLDPEFRAKMDSEAMERQREFMASQWT